MNLKDISKNEPLLIKIIKGNNENIIVKIFSDEDTCDRYIYTNENGNIMFSGSTSCGPIDEHTLFKAFKKVVHSDISQFKLVTSSRALYIAGKLS